ncbi:MAG: hypothetical protein ACJ8FP_08785 [Xanthobacteraceae bacterium]
MTAPNQQKQNDILAQKNQRGLARLLVCATAAVKRLLFAKNTWVVPNSADISKANSAVRIFSCPPAIR